MDMTLRLISIGLACFAIGLSLSGFMYTSLGLLLDKKEEEDEEEEECQK